MADQQASFQTVFKISLGSNGPDVAFHPRKPHRKSRRGCLTCKTRRLKCDEVKPTCTRCTRGASKCVYPTMPADEAATASSSGSTTPSPSAAENTMAVDLFDSQLKQLLSSGKKHVLQTSEDTRILQHFYSVTAYTTGGEPVHRAMQESVARKGWSNPYVVRMALAVTASHLKRLTCDSELSEMYRQYSMAESEHGNAGLQLFRQQMSSKKKLDFDAAVATSFLLNIFTFSMQDDILSDSIEQSLVRAIQPLNSLPGFRIMRVGGLMDAPDMDTSPWPRVLSQADDDKGTFDEDRPGLDGLPAALVDLCGLTEESTCESSPYHHILRRITPLLNPDIEFRGNVSKYLAFIGRSWAQFKPLLDRKDPPALLILAYWFASLRQPMWWCRPQERTKALVRYLKTINDPKIDALLLYPETFGEEGRDLIWQPITPQTSVAVTVDM